MPAKSKAQPKAGKKATAKIKLAWEKEAVRLTKQVLREHPSLRTLNDTQVHGTLIAGVSLYEALKKDKYSAQAKLPGAPSFGSTYYKAMATKYQGSGSSSSGGSFVLTGELAAAPLSEDLVEACCGWEDSPKRPAAMFEYLSLCDKETFCFLCFVCVCVCVCVCSCVCVC